MYGRWEVYAGQFFSEWEPKVHVKKREIPSDWRITVSIDYGLDMFAPLWFAERPDGKKIRVFKELRVQNLPIPAAAQMLLANCDGKEQMFIAPPDMWNRRQDTGRSMADIFNDYGIPLVKSGNDRIDGWANVKECLEVNDGESILEISEDCVGLIEDIPLLLSDPKKPNDVAAEPHEHTHAPDALRYKLSMWRPVKEPVKEKERYEFKILKPKDNSMGEVTEEYLSYGS